MRKITLILCLVALSCAGCATGSLEKAIGKLNYQKHPVTGAESWVIWNTPTFQYSDNYDDYEINSYLKCTKLGDNITIGMVTHSAVEQILKKYEIVTQNGTSYIELGEYSGRRTALYKGLDSHVDVYSKDLTKADLESLASIVKFEGGKLRPVSDDSLRNFPLEKVSDGQKMQINAILTTCGYM